MPIREQQTTNKQHAIPQSIMSVEFKIIGDLTLKQFFFLMIFCGLAYASFMLISAFVIKWLLVVFFVLTGLAFAFLPLGDRGLDTWIINFLRAMFLPNQFVYRKDENVPSVFLYQNLDVLKNELITLTPTSSRRKIEEYLQQQEAPVDKLDIDEKSFILKVRQAYSQQDYWTGAGAGLTPAGGSANPYPSVSTTVVEDFLPQEQAQQQNQTRGVLVQAPQIQPTQVQPMLVQTQPPAPPPQPPKQPTKPRTTEQDYQSRKQPHRQSAYYAPSITPDMRAGRMFINLSQETAHGEIILPVRGERVIMSSQELELEAKEQQKIKELDDLLKDVRNKESIQKQIINAKKLQEQDEARKNSLEQATQRVESQTQHHAQAEQSKRAQEGIEEKERQRLTLLRTQEEALSRQKEGLLKKQGEEREIREKKVINLLTEDAPAKPQPIPLTPAQINESPTTPNIIWGLVTTSYQNTVIGVPGVVVVIRNQKGEVVRAVKTGAQGKFGITTPLISGSYTIEVDKEKKSGLNFAITAADAKGELIPTIEIAGTA